MWILAGREALVSAVPVGTFRKGGLTLLNDFGGAPAFAGLYGWGEMQGAERPDAEEGCARLDAYDIDA